MEFRAMSPALLLTRAASNLSYRSLRVRSWNAFLHPAWLRIAAGGICVIIARLLGIALAVLGGMLVDALLRTHTAKTIWELSLWGFGIVLVQAALTKVSVVVVTGEAQRIISGARKRLLAHIIRLPLSLVDMHLAAGLSSQIMTDTESLRTVFSNGTLDLVGSLAMAIGAMAVLGRVAPEVAIGIAAVSIPFAVGVVWLLRELRRLYVDRSERFTRLSGRIGEALGGIRVLKALCAEDYESGVLGNLIERVDGAEGRFYRATSWLGLIATLTIGGCFLITMLVGGRAVLWHHLSPGDFFICLLLVSYLVMPLMQTLSVGAQMAVAGAAIQRTGEIIRWEKEGVESGRHIQLEAIKGDVFFDEVSFGYDPGQIVLHAVTFRAYPGSITAIVGPSGAGKTTMMNLLCGFAEPQYGLITVDGIDLRNVDLRSLRKQLGIVLQDTFLFAGSIYDNVSYARPEATRAEVLAACKLAHVEEFASQLPRGYDTLVGERGVALSGGQRQRVSIARAFLTNPRILILDEATANIDVETEGYLRDSYARLREGRTIFIVSHRESAIRIADQVLVLRNGRIVERGTHADLLARRGAYYKMIGMELVGVVA